MIDIHSKSMSVAYLKECRDVLEDRVNGTYVVFYPSNSRLTSVALQETMSRQMDLPYRREPRKCCATVIYITNVGCTVQGRWKRDVFEAHSSTASLMATNSGFSADRSLSLPSR